MIYDLLERIPFPGGDQVLLPNVLSWQERRRHDSSTFISGETESKAVK